MPDSTSSPDDQAPVGDTRSPNPTPKPATGFQVPSLKILAGKAVKKRHQFFYIHDKELDPEITTLYIQPIINQLISESEKNYALQREERQEKMEELSSELRQQPWFNKLLTWVLGLGLTGLHIGIYFILREDDDIDEQTKLAFISSVPVSLLVGLCVGACCLPKPLAWAIAYFRTPAVPSNLIIDLDQEAKKGSPSI